jgi:hypothetical protein
VVVVVVDIFKLVINHRGFGNKRQTTSIAYNFHIKIGWNE